MKTEKYSIFLAACLMILVALMFQTIANATDYFIHSMPLYVVEANDSDCGSGSFGGAFTQVGECRRDWCMTPSEVERDAAIANGWESQGVPFYVSMAEIPGTVALYRLYNPDSSDHLFTVSPAERNSAMGNGYLDEGKVGYVLPPYQSGMGAVNLFRFYAGGDQTYHRYSNSMEKQYNEVLEGGACGVWPSDIALVSMAVTAPKQFEHLQGNSEYKITWNTSRAGGFVDVYYSKLYGTATDYIPIALGIANTGSLIWKVPNVNTIDATIQIVWWDNLFGPAYQLARVQSKLFTIKSIISTKVGAVAEKLVAKPSAPSPLTATAVSASESRLSWKASTGGLIGYVVERRTGQGMFRQVARIKAPDLTYSDKNVTPGTHYSYRVYAYNMGGHSGYSNEASAKTAIALRKPISMKQKSTKKVAP
jgi:Repeat of unknown function (DUF5648)/Fibronectin type III domain